MFRFQLLYRLRGNYSNNQLCSSVLQLLPSRRKREIQVHKTVSIFNVDSSCTQL